MVARVENPWMWNDIPPRRRFLSVNLEELLSEGAGQLTVLDQLITPLILSLVSVSKGDSLNFETLEALALSHNISVNAIQHDVEMLPETPDELLKIVRERDTNALDHINARIREKRITGEETTGNRATNLEALPPKRITNYNEL